MYMRQFESIDSMDFVEFLSINIKSPVFYVLMDYRRSFTAGLRRVSFYRRLNYIIYVFKVGL